jgi:hypothetical protein
MKKIITVVIILSALIGNAQNTLNNVGLTSVAPASVAYSVRQLSTSYTGPLVRIKVGASFYDVYPDDQTKKFTVSSKISAPIGTYNAAVAGASANALSTIISGTTDATVAIWYDQSGNAVHVLSSGGTAKIITAGSINMMNGQPTIRFFGSGSSSNLISVNTVNFSTQTLATVNAVAQNIATTDLVSGVISTGNSGGWGLNYDPTNSFKGYWIDGSGEYGATVNENSTDAKIITGLMGISTSSSIYSNSVLRGTRAAHAIANGVADKINVGIRGEGASQRQFNGNISETMLFPKNLTSVEQAALESSQSIYLTASVTITSSATGAVCSGTSVTFTASTTGMSSPSFQWYKNSVAINGATSSTLTTTTLNNNDQIYVTATGAITSNVITTTITASPSATLTVLGDGCINKTTLSATSGQTSYTWYKDGGAISGAASNTYKPTTAGEYKVQVLNGTCATMSTLTTISTCGVTASGRMSILETSTTLVSKSGAKNSGKGVSERGKILTQPPPPLITTGLQLHYDTNNAASYSGSGPNLTDLSGNGRHGTLENSPSFTTLSATAGGGVLSFNGTNQYISTTYTPANTCTISIWFYNNLNYSDFNRGIFSTYNIGVANSTNGIYMGTRSPSLNLSRDANVGYANSVLPSLTINTWYNVTVTSDPSGTSGTGTIKVYLNGNLQTTLTGAKTTHAAVLNIGRSRYDANYWSGYLGSVMVYNTALSDTDVLTNYNSQKTRFGY